MIHPEPGKPVTLWTSDGRPRKCSMENIMEASSSCPGNTHCHLVWKFWYYLRATWYYWYNSPLSHHGLVRSEMVQVALAIIHIATLFGSFGIISELPGIR
jgi:hypothetical protein